MKVTTILLICGAIICAAQVGTGYASEVLAEPGRSVPPSELERARHFDSHIAPLLARHCLECHDSVSRKGRLDLSRKDEALGERRRGRAVVPGNLAESMVWEYVEAGEMPPEDRPPLSEEEKQLLREWIEAGAIWSGDTIDPLALNRDSRAVFNWVQRLTVPEYIETVRSAAGVDVEKEARQILPQDLRADGFNNTAYNLSVDLSHIEAYAQLAEIIVNRMDVMAFAAEHNPGQDLEHSNVRDIISGMGQWLLRGPLQEHEITAFQRVADSIIGDGGDFSEALSYVLEAMLQSPRFIYRMETEVAEGTASQFAEYELASRLSYILWGGPPDKELMRAADAGELSDRTKVEEQVERMLEDPRVVKRSVQFVYEWLDLDRLSSLRPNPERFPEWNEQLANDMREETLEYFKHVVWEQKRPLADLMNAQVTFASPRLAYFYGLEENPAGVRNGAPFEAGQDEALQALYLFDEGQGGAIRDRSNNGEPLNLTIEDASAVEWTEGGLKVNDPAFITTSEPPARLIEAIKQSNAISIEGWITPSNDRQGGPARIITLSSGASQRNFSFAQDNDRYEVRLRSTGTSANGLPSLGTPAGSVAPRPDHVVFTRDKSGKATLYLNGQEAVAADVVGDLSNWDSNFRLFLANESTKDRPWRGTIHQLAIYSRALSREEIQSRSSGISSYDLAEVPSRGGLLTHASVLTVGGDEASMVTRGLFVLRDFLFSTVGSAPPGADTTPIPPKPGLSQRAVAEIRLADQSCAGCHSRFEPLAFGLEKFNGIGAFLERDEHGNELRDDGEILFPGDSHPVSYRSSAEFMDLLAGSERIRMNMTRKVTQFALGRPLIESDARLLEQIHQAAQEGGGTYTSLITAIVMSDLVQMTPGRQ